MADFHVQIDGIVVDGTACRLESNFIIGPIANLDVMWLWEESHNPL